MSLPCFFPSVFLPVFLPLTHPPFLRFLLSLSLCPLPCVFPLCSRSHPHCLSILSLSQLYLLFLPPSLSPYFLFFALFFKSPQSKCISSLCPFLSAPHLSFPPLFLPSDCPTFRSLPYLILSSLSLSPFKSLPPCLFPASVSLCVYPFVSLLFSSPLFVPFCLFPRSLLLFALLLCLCSVSSLLSLSLCLSPYVFVLYATMDIKFAFNNYETVNMYI